MSNYRRATFPGGYYFFTVITYRRHKLFSNPKARQLLRNACQKVQIKHPFEITALCLLPEHIHCIWKLPTADADFSTRWRLIKTYFTKAYLTGACRELPQSRSRRKKGEKPIWQRRFWEHQIRNEKDLQSHIDYIHYNPVKHQLVDSVTDWPWSTYHRFVKDGFYKHAITDNFTGNFGENSI